MSFFSRFLLLGCSLILIHSCATVEKKDTDKDKDVEKRTTTVVKPKVVVPAHKEIQDLSSKTKTIAVLLPLAAPKNTFLHKAGTAIRIGLLLKMYSSKNNATTLFINTYQRDIKDAYQEAKDANVDVIFGPLLANNVQEISTYDSDIPVVAFNNAESDKENWYNLSLSISEEAKTLANSIATSGHTSAFILYSSSKWARNAAATFEERWLKQGKSIASSVMIGHKKTSDYISKLLGITKRDIRTYSTYMKQRNRAISKAQNKENPQDFIDPLYKLEIEEREEFIDNVTRASSGDFIYLIADSKAARQIKPLLSFYLSNDLQVYSTSKINYVKTDYRKNRDLSSIIFSDLPWILDGKYKLQKLFLHSLWPNLGNMYNRFYALGYDILSVSHLLDLEKNNKNKSDNIRYISGATGKLYIHEGKLHREGIWGHFIRGKVKLLKQLPDYKPAIKPWEWDPINETPKEFHIDLDINKNKVKEKKIP